MKIVCKHKIGHSIQENGSWSGGLYCVTIKCNTCGKSFYDKVTGEYNGALAVMFDKPTVLNYEGFEIYKTEEEELFLQLEGRFLRKGQDINDIDEFLVNSISIDKNHELVKRSLSVTMGLSEALDSIEKMKVYPKIGVGSTEGTISVIGKGSLSKSLIKELSGMDNVHIVNMDFEQPLKIKEEMFNVPEEINNNIITVTTDNNSVDPSTRKYNRKKRK